MRDILLARIDLDLMLYCISSKIEEFEGQKCEVSINIEDKQRLTEELKKLCLYFEGILEKYG